uniref:Bromo domain-containing protein n=1 Tax=Fibrocapsa japonica TaxID=94617 RepID=A0A7S2V5Q0_9STRA|mmetsp:Transcript_5580/g.8454  ORF Transcript_5580/g.8454 Transcript_5580/m.8454 type:complete len:352 (+) Transcript_5580:70-1125(+)
MTEREHQNEDGVDAEEEGEERPYLLWTKREMNKYKSENPGAAAGARDLMAHFGLQDYAGQLLATQLPRTFTHFLPPALQLQHQQEQRRKKLQRMESRAGAAEGEGEGARAAGGGEATGESLAALVQQQPFDRPLEKFPLEQLRRSFVLDRGPRAGEVFGRSPSSTSTGSSTSKKPLLVGLGGANAGANKRPRQMGLVDSSRARAPVFPATSPPDLPSAPLPRADQVQKVLRPVVNSLWKMNFGGQWGNPFRTVIDQENCVALGVANYFDFIERPMNLTWIKEKMNSKKYSSLGELTDDVELMVQNAHKYNRPNEEVYIFATTLREKYYKIISSISEQVLDEFSKPSKKRKI